MGSSEAERFLARVPGQKLTEDGKVTERSLRRRLPSRSALAGLFEFLSAKINGLSLPNE